MLGYFTTLLENVHERLVSGDITPHGDPPVPTVASQGPSYTSLDELEANMAEKRRGLTTKPHYLTQTEMELAAAKTAKAKRAAANKK